MLRPTPTAFLSHISRVTRGQKVAEPAGRKTLISSNAKRFRVRLELKSKKARLYLIIPDDFGKCRPKEIFLDHDFFFRGFVGIDGFFCPRVRLDRRFFAVGFDGISAVKGLPGRNIFPRGDRGFQRSIVYEG